MKPRLFAWLLFLACAALIMLTLELAYETSLYLQARGYLWSTVQLLLGVSLLVTGYLVVFSIRLRSASAYVRGSLALALLIACMLSLRESPSERFHFVEYGVLYLLALRAVVIDFPRWPAYLLALLPTGLVGWLDEWLQTLSPVRYFDPLDIWINLLAAALAGLVCAGLLGSAPERLRAAVRGDH